jgi:hypothetical protein
MTTEETNKLIAEQQKLLAEALKFSAEEQKLRHEAVKFSAEEQKLRIERYLLPLAMAGAFFGSLVGVATLVIHLGR